MKKVVVGSVSLLMCAFILWDCSENRGKEKDAIIGTWKFHHFSPVQVITDNENVTKMIEETVSNSFRLHAVYSFQEDGKIYWISGKNRGNSPYMIEGNKITFTFNGETLTKEFTIKDNVFSVYSDYTEYFWDYGLYYLGIDPNSVSITSVVVAKNFIRKESNTKQRVE